MFSSCSANYGSWIIYSGNCAYNYNTTSPNGAAYDGSYYSNTEVGNHYVITSIGR